MYVFLCIRVIDICKWINKEYDEQKKDVISKLEKMLRADRVIRRLNRSHDCGRRFGAGKRRDMLFVRG
jgi:hypothetical protein